MKLDENGYKLIMGFEGLSLVPYLCAAKVPTIGYGSTFYPSGKKVTMQDTPINLESAKLMLKETQKTWDNVSHHLTKTESPYPAENVTTVEAEELADGHLG